MIYFLRKIEFSLRWGILFLIIASSAILMFNAAIGDSAVIAEQSRLWEVDQIISWARVIPIFLTLILITAVYFWSKDLIGRWWAFLPTFLVAFSPNFLAYGHYIIADSGAALSIFLAVTMFLNFLLSPSRKNLICTGLALGLAQLLKFTAFLLVPYFLLLIILFYLISLIRDWRTTETGQRFRRFKNRLWKYFRSVLIIFIIGYMLVGTLYLFISYFNPSLLPEILSAITDHSSGAANRYSLPLIFLMKEPISSLILIIFALGYSLFSLISGSIRVIFHQSRTVTDFLTTYFAEFAILLFVGIYWTLSLSNGPQLDLRQLLPTMPFIYILTAGALKQWFSLQNAGSVRNFAVKIFILYQELASISIKSAVLVALLSWYLVSTLITAPSFISYFNVIFGGLRYGYQNSTSSNYDWGQDLKRLGDWIDKNVPTGEKIAVDYVGGSSPKYYLGEQAEIWWSAKGNPINENINWLAVSISSIQSAKLEITKNIQRKSEDEYQWLAEPYKPFARAGTSIFIYKLK